MDDNILMKIGETVENISELRDQHWKIFCDLKKQNVGASRVEKVRKCVEMLDLSVEEGRLLLAIEEWSDIVEEDQSRTEFALLRLKDDNDMLRERLEQTENQLEDVLSKIAELEVHQQQHAFMIEVNVWC